LLVATNQRIRRVDLLGLLGGPFRQAGVSLKSIGVPNGDEIAVDLSHVRGGGVEGETQDLIRPADVP